MLNNKFFFLFSIFYNCHRQYVLNNFYNVVNFSFVLAIVVRSKELDPAVSSAILGKSVGSIVRSKELGFAVFFIFSLIFS